MRVSVTEDCVACELCVETCSEVFQMGEEFAEVIIEDQVPKEHEEAVEEAADICPTEAIIIEE